MITTIFTGVGEGDTRSIQVMVGERDIVHGYVARENEMLPYDVCATRRSQTYPAVQLNISVVWNLDVKAISCAKEGKKREGPT